METREFIKGGSSDDKAKRIESIVIVPRKREGHTKLFRRQCYPAWNVFDAPSPLAAGQETSSLSLNPVHLNSPFLEASTFSVYCGYANGFISFYAGSVDAPDTFQVPATIAAIDEAFQNNPQNKVTLQLVESRSSMRDGSTSSPAQVAAEWRTTPARVFSLSDQQVHVMHGESLDPVEGYFDVPSMSSNVQLMAHAKCGDTPLLALLSKKQINILLLSEHRAAVQASSSGQPLIVSDGVVAMELTTHTVIVGTRREITVYCVRTNQLLDTLVLEKNIPVQMRSNLHGSVLIRASPTSVIALSVGDGKDISFDKARKFEIPANLGPGPQNRGEDQVVDFTITDPFFSIYTQTGKLLTRSLYYLSEAMDEEDEEDGLKLTNILNSNSSSSTNINNNNNNNANAVAKSISTLFDMPPIQCADAKFLVSYGSIIICVSISNDLQVVVQNSASMQAYALIGMGAIARSVPHYICAAGPLDAMTEDDEMKVNETVAALHYAAAKRACRTGQHADAWDHFREARSTVQQVLAEVPMLTKTDKPPSSGMLGGAQKLVELLLFLLRRAQREDDEDDIRALNWALLIVLTSDIAVNPPLAKADREQYLTDLLAPPGRHLPALDVAQARLDAAQRFVSPECLTTCKTFLLFANEEAQEALEVCRERKSVADAGLCLIAVIEQYANGDPSDLADLLIQQLPWMIATNASQACKALRSVKKSVVWDGLVVDAVTQVFIGYPLERCKMLQYFVVGGATLNPTSVSLQRLHSQYTSALILVVKVLKLMSGTGSHTVDVVPGHETGLLGVWRSELLRHLKSSNYYDTDLALMELSTAVDPHSFVGIAQSTEHLPLRFRVLRFYASYNPDKIDSVDDSLASLKGLPDSEVMNRLTSKYGAEPKLSEQVLLDVAKAAIDGTLYGANGIPSLASVAATEAKMKKSASGMDHDDDDHHQTSLAMTMVSGKLDFNNTNNNNSFSVVQQQQQQHAPRAPFAAALYHETAIVHSKRNDDSAALHTLLYEMNDVDAALIFCLETTGDTITNNNNNNNHNHNDSSGPGSAGNSRLNSDIFGGGSPTSPNAFLSPYNLQSTYSPTTSFVPNAASAGGEKISPPGIHNNHNHHHDDVAVGDNISPIGRGRNHYQSSNNLLVTAGSPEMDDLVHGGRNVTTTTRSGRMLTLLVQKLLRPPPGFDRKLEEAVAILSRHAENLDAEAVLSVVPADVPLTRFAPYLSRHFEQSSHKKHELLAKAHVLASEHFRLQQQLYRLHNRAVLVDEERMCSVCQKRLGDVMVVVYPNMRVVHFRCAKDRTRDPVSQLPFFQTVL